MKKLLMCFFAFFSYQVHSSDLIFKNDFDDNALVAGSVSSLNSTGLSLKLSFATTEQTLIIATSGSFIFSLEVPVGEIWSVSVQTQPTNPCTLSNAIGTMTTAGVGNVLVTCTDVFNNWDEMQWDQGVWQ